MTRKLARALSPPAALAVVTHLNTFPLVPVDGATVLRAVQLHQNATLSFWDALIVQAALGDFFRGRRFGRAHHLSRLRHAAPAGSLECSGCGLVICSDMDVKPDPICPRCGAVVGVSGTHCPNCAAPLPKT